MEQKEIDYRLGILNSLLTSTHRELDKNYAFHTQVRTDDPLFYERLASWYNDKGDVRDHQHLFIANLCMSDFDGHREVGLALLRKLPPFQLVKVLEFIKSKRAVPRCVRTEVTRYLQEREKDDAWFDNAVITGRKQLKWMYAFFRVKPSDRAQAILFDNNPPKDSKCYALKEIAKTQDPTVQAQLINEYKIPYRIASTIVKEMTPSILAVLIDGMSSQELINTMGAMQKRGAFDNPEIKKLVDKKLQEAKSSKKVSALKGLEAVKAAGLSEELNEQLKEVVDKQVKNKGRIKRSTAILVDKSASMETGIELSKQIATMISAVMDADLKVYAFDVMSYRIESKGTELKHWEQAFRGIKAAGGTAPSVSVLQLLKDTKDLNNKTEQIILITDEGENNPNDYRRSLDIYTREAGVKPYTCIVRCGSGRWGVSDRITKSLRESGYDVDDWEFKGGEDYYSLPNLIHFLTKPSRTDLLMEIMDYPLARRKLVAA
jgi:hypothetical protein